jgi:uncharacterized membrane protein
MSTDPERDHAVKRLKAKRGFRSLAATTVLVSLIWIGIWAASGGGTFWPILPILSLVIVLLVSAWQAYGPERRAITDDEIRREIERRG